MDIFQSTDFWVLLGFVIFVALVYKKVTGVVTEKLDERSDAIRNQIEEARTLREEAQAMLAQYQRQQRDAEKTAAEIVSSAKRQASDLLKQAQADAEAAGERQKKIAETRIQQMEAQAVAEVRAVAAEVAVQATRSVIEQQLDDAKASDILADSIDKLPARLN
ncbi:MAG: F0F1 ATP synthase subunit B [Pseudomonadota bacterium]